MKMNLKRRAIVRRGHVWKAWNISACDCGRDWSRIPAPSEKERIQETIAAIRADVDTILDAGCGNGWICNTLNGRYRVVGVDYVSEPLRYVQAPKVRGDLRRLPFPDKSFDLVLCCEVLEHLDDSMYETVLSELLRATRKYILVTVPNNEDLSIFCYKCPKCGTNFNPTGHLRSFTLKKLRALFSGSGEDRIECLEAREIVPVPLRPQNVFLSRLRLEKFGYWSKNSEAVCPNCGCLGNSARRPLALRLYRLALRLANATLNPRKRPRATWLLAVYRVERVK